MALISMAYATHRMQIQTVRRVIERYIFAPGKAAMAGIMKKRKTPTPPPATKYAYNPPLRGDQALITPEDFLRNTSDIICPPKLEVTPSVDIYHTSTFSIYHIKCEPQTTSESDWNHSTAQR